MDIHSWGRYPIGRHQHVLPIFWQDNLKRLPDNGLSYLPYGQGLSYGDNCLNFDNGIIALRGLDRFESFDMETGVLRCEAGVTLDEVLRLIVPKGWFLPVTPGTKYVTIGGSIANDVHGKDHHKAGTFGRHIRAMGVWRSDGTVTICTPKEHADLYAATIGGLGLTGVILWAELQLVPIRSPYIEVENIRYSNLEEFFEISDDSATRFDYSVAWIDCLNADVKTLGRGIFMRGNFSRTTAPLVAHSVSPSWLRVPCDAPDFAINSLSMTAFNTLYYGKQFAKHTKKLVPYNSFFYPLDAIKHWNRIYGKRGFFQYQFVIPFENHRRNMIEILTAISKSGLGSFLAVIKSFEDMPSPGLLSFPKPGITLALDFPNKGKVTRELFRKLDELVVAAGGRLYPAKDACMAGEFFRSSYPNLATFRDFVDPRLSSSFWRRVHSN